MAETLGSLCDKLTIIKLKQYHSKNQESLDSLAVQEHQLQEEIDDFIRSAVAGTISSERLTFAANKVYKKEGNKVSGILGSIGQIFSRLADVNSQLWHTQEFVYEFEKVPPEEKDQIIKKLALLNLERNNCIDHIDKQFQQIIKKQKNNP